MADPTNFFGRWSRLKQEARKPPRPTAVAGSPATGEAAPEAMPAELPPIESLTAESDISVFLRPDVPEAVRNAALQKLWRSDSVFANLDGLVEYDEDFAADFKSAAIVRTAYQVLQGMPDGREPTKADVAPTAESSDAIQADADPRATVSTAGFRAPRPTDSKIEPSVVPGRRREKDGLD